MAYVEITTSGQTYNQSTYQTGFEPTGAGFSKCFDGDNATYWRLINVATSDWATIQFSSSQRVAKYTVLYHYGYWFTSWKLYGSNDGTNWTEIDSRSPGDNQKVIDTTYEYVVTTPGNYTYYKFGNLAASTSVHGFFCTIKMYYDDTYSAGKTISVSDTFSLSESNANQRARLLSVIDTFSLTEALSALRSRVLSVSDSFSLSEAVSVAKAVLISVIDSVMMNELVYPYWNKLLNVADTMYVTELSVSALRSRIVAASDSIGLTEALTSARGLAVRVSDAVGLSEGVSALKSLIVRVLDYIGLIDSSSVKQVVDSNVIRVPIEFLSCSANIELSSFQIGVELKGTNINTSL